MLHIKIGKFTTLSIIKFLYLSYHPYYKSYLPFFGQMKKIVLTVMARAARMMLAVLMMIWFGVFAWLGLVLKMADQVY